MSDNMWTTSRHAMRRRIVQEETELDRRLEKQSDGESTTEDEDSEIPLNMVSYLC